MNLQHFRDTLELNKTKRTLREQVQAKLILPWGGGLFKVTPELISFVDVLAKYADQTVIEDSQGNPVLIEDLKEFQQAVIEAYQVEMNYWYHRYLEVKTTRKPDSV